MRFPKEKGRKARIEIIPMIDTMFFLLVFFMIATLSMQQHYQLPVQLPQAQGQPAQKQVVVTLTREGGLFYEQEAVSSTSVVLQRLSQEGSAKKEVQILLRADRQVEHGRVVEMLDKIRNAGVRKVSIAVTPTGR